MIRKTIFIHEFITGKPCRKPLRFIPNFDYANLYPEVQRVHHIIPDTTHVVDYIDNIRQAQGRSNIMERMVEMAREHGFTVITARQTNRDDI